MFEHLDSTRLHLELARKKSVHLQVDLLAGRLRHASEMTITGEVLVNDKAVDYASFRKCSAYVQQEDHLPPTETVRECLMFSAQLRLPGILTRAERVDRVNSIIDELVRFPRLRGVAILASTYRCFRCYVDMQSEAVSLNFAAC
jgi:hypothetical protein